MMRYTQIYSFHHVCESPRILQTCRSYQRDHLSSGVYQERLPVYPVQSPSSDHPEKFDQTLSLVFDPYPPLEGIMQ